jgi:uncharacterized protein YqcC (DUF446 family)
MVKKIKRKKAKKGGRGRHPSAGPFLAELDRIERELRGLGWWRDTPVDPFAHLAADAPRSYLDASSFEEWLQFVFLPNARAGARAGTLPATSNVGDMARQHYDYQTNVAEAQALIQLLSGFDEMVEAHHARRGGGR